MTQESWNLKLLTLIFKARFDNNMDYAKWGDIFKSHWKAHPGTGEYKMGWGTYLKTIKEIDPKIIDAMPDELSDVLNDVEIDDDEDSVPF